MISKILKGFGYLLAVLLLLSIATVTLVDRQPYLQTAFYAEMNTRLDSLASVFTHQKLNDTLEVGWSSISIMPSGNPPLAGYGARDPKEMTAIHDSVFFKVFVLKLGDKQAAIVTADLLIIHPELKKAFYKMLPQSWNPNEIFFTASHTHSGIGGWAPGLVGELFAGGYDNDIVQTLTSRLLLGLERAESNISHGLIGYSKLSVEDLVYNRLVKEKGIVDPWFQVLQFLNSQGSAILSSYSAHATCLGRNNTELSGDYPSPLNKMLSLRKNGNMAAFMAGPVGSMGPNSNSETGWKQAEFIATGLSEQFDLLDIIGIPYQSTSSLVAFRLKLTTRAPYFKISKNLALRPYLFKQAFGNYQAEISVLKINNLLLIGMPCDFSGELAVPLYEKASALGMDLIITSFNGDYLGYVIKDEWYDLEKYESRTMSWYGPDMGSYMTEVASRIIEIVDES